MRPQGASILERCRALAEPIAEELGLELFDVHLLREGGRLILRFVIDSEQGITHSDCERFSRMIDPVLDEEDPIEKSYFLEVSSPGAERPLRHEADYHRFIGKMACLVVGEDVPPAPQSQSAPGGLLGQTDTSKLRARSSVRRPQRNTIIEGRIVAVQNGIVTMQIGSQQQREISLAAVRSAHLLLEQNGGERKKR